MSGLRARVQQLYDPILISVATNTMSISQFETSFDCVSHLHRLHDRHCLLQPKNAKSMASCHIVRLDIERRLAHVRIKGGRVEAPVRLEGVKKLVVHGVRADWSTDQKHVRCLAGDEVIFEGVAHDVKRIEGDTIIFAANDDCAVFVPREMNPEINTTAFVNDQDSTQNGSQAAIVGASTGDHDSCETPSPQNVHVEVQSTIGLQTPAAHEPKQQAADPIGLVLEWDPTPTTVDLPKPDAISAEQKMPTVDTGLSASTVELVAQEHDFPFIDFSVLETPGGQAQADTIKPITFADSILSMDTYGTTKKSRNISKSRVVCIKEVQTIDELMSALEEQRRSPIIRIGEALTGLGYITQSDLNHALEAQRSSGSVQLGEILVRKGVITKNQLRLALGAKLAYPVVDVEQFPLDADVLRRVPIDIALEHRIIPLHWQQRQLLVAAETPANHSMHDDIEFKLQCKLVCAISKQPLAPELITQVYGRFGLGKGAMDSSHSLLEALNAPVVEDEVEAIEENDNSLVKLINAIIVEAYQSQASDIHFETYPGKRKMRVRFRRDGRMFLHMELPHTYSSAVVARLKIMADLDISEKRKSQDGKINFARYSPQHSIELRVSTVPTINGAEDVVLRVLGSARPMSLADIGMTPENLEMARAAVERPYGLILCVGPTGSGKTTTLHAMLGAANAPDRKIWTAEDPVEITHPDFRQVQVNPKIDWTFAKALRAFLRSDPDIIMVGEIRDEETARVAIEASLTGHLVLSTLHTNSAAETVARLLDMGLDPFNFADSLELVIAQRLVRKVCPACVKMEPIGQARWQEIVTDYWLQFPESARPSKELVAAELRAAHENDDGLVMLPVAIGCKACHDTGFRGRIGVHEVLRVDRGVRRLIQNKAPSEDIQAQAFKSGHFRTLRQDGLSKMLMGLTTLEEVRSNTA